MTHYEKSAIIGYWRCGADTMQIAGIMECCQEVVIKTIVDYVRNNKQEELQDEGKKLC